MGEDEGYYFDCCKCGAEAREEDQHQVTIEPSDEESCKKITYFDAYLCLGCVKKVKDFIEKNPPV